MISESKLQQSSRLGRLVVMKGWITAEQLDVALKHQIENKCRLGESLVNLELLSEKQLNKVLCKQKWVRSFIAGVVMVTSPICPVLASEGTSTLQFTMQSDTGLQDTESKFTAKINAEQLEFSNKDRFHAGISHSFSSLGGVEFGVSKMLLASELFRSGEVYVPQITLFASHRNSRKLDFNSDWHYRFNEKNRSDRYKNTIPAVYRLSLKGYSVFEKSDKIAKFWSFDKMKGQPYKKYEIMFSVTKRF